MRNRCSVLTDLFLSFAKVGCFTFGGGYSMISVITDTCVEKKKWISHDEMMNVTVIAESTPGPIAINCATYVGYKLAGMAGAVVATLGIVVPSFVIIYLISNFLDNFLAYPLVAKAFLGIKVGVGILILDAGLTMLRKMQKSDFFYNIQKKKKKKNRIRINKNTLIQRKDFVTKKYERKLSRK